VRNPSDERKCAHLLGLVAQGKPLELCKADLLKDEVSTDGGFTNGSVTGVSHLPYPCL
jgi:hypothetical protein